MRLKALAMALPLGFALASMPLGGCKKGGDDAAQSRATDAGSVIPTEEDYEEAAEAAITPANLDAEIAKLEAELSDTTKK